MASAHKVALAKNDAGLFEKPPAPTLAEFLRQRVRPWAAKRKPTTRTWYESGIRPLLTCATIASKRIDQLTSEHIDRYCALRQTDHAIGSVKRELRILRRVLRLAVEWRELEHAPHVRMAGAEVKRERVVSDEEFKRYLGSTSELLADVSIVLSKPACAQKSVTACSGKTSI